MKSLDPHQVVCVKFSKKILGMWAQVKPWARSGALGESSAQRPGGGLGSLPHHKFFVFAEFLHVEITVLLEPVLMRLHGQRPD